MPTPPIRMPAAVWPSPIKTLAISPMRAHFDTARAAYRQAVIGMEEIARRNSKSVMACRDQTVALLKLLELEASAGRHAAVAAWAECGARGPDRQGGSTLPRARRGGRRGNAASRCLPSDRSVCR